MAGRQRETPRPPRPPRAAPAPTRRGLALLAAALASRPAAAEDDVFALLEAAWAAREGGPDAIARGLGAGPYRAVPDLNDLFESLAADLPGTSPFATLEVRHRRTGGAGLALLEARPGRGPARDAVRARYGEGTWWDVRPEHTVNALAYRRPGGWLFFGFARDGGPFVQAGIHWGLG